MPIYEYQCKQCNHTFEHLQLNTDLPPQSCPECGQAIEKLMSAGSFNLNTGTDVSAGTCCGQHSPCDSPKHCCGMSH
ncbi:MAG: zinc ribbon domain-containing protein [Candidatus Magnetomorum sp.]|nr:zinc ribbon domain-containing protein [Candidatus Magnetomorum sp.]